MSKYIEFGIKDGSVIVCDEEVARLQCVETIRKGDKTFGLNKFLYVPSTSYNVTFTLDELKAIVAALEAMTEEN